jgi:S1-C subfamily serine protease
MKSISVLAVVISMSCACLGQSARDIARVAFRSVVLLEMNDSNGQPLSLGSGFFVSNGIIATNAHVIEGASSGTAKLVGDSHTMQILGTVAIDRHADLALLKVDSPAPPLVLGPNANPIVGDDVYVVGNPLGLEGTFSEGIISGVRQVDADSILQMTAPISPGSSGGPVMNSSGAVIGISVATFQDGQNLNLAVPVSYLSRLLALPSRSLLPLGNQTTGNQAEKSLLAGLGTRIESGVKVGNLKFSPSGGIEFRLANELSVDVLDIKLLVLYSDLSGSPMDYEQFQFDGPILAGLTKMVDFDSATSEKAAYYYQRKRLNDYEAIHGIEWSLYKQNVVIDGALDTKFVEIRILSFKSSKTD